MTHFYTYLHCKPNGDPFYVGKGTGKRSHKFSSSRNKHHRSIVAKYGKENIGVFIFQCDSENQSFSDEIQQIAQLRREGYDLSNKSSGGEGTSGCTWRLSELTRAKMSKAKQNMSDETRAKVSSHSKIMWADPCFKEKMSKAKIGNKNSLGRIHSAETCAKMSAARMGRKSWNKGKPLSKEHRAKLVISSKGKQNALGCHWNLSPETKEKMSIAKKAMWAKRKETLEPSGNAD